MLHDVPPGTRPGRALNAPQKLRNLKSHSGTPVVAAENVNTAPTVCVLNPSIKASSTNIISIASSTKASTVETLH